MPKRNEKEHQGARTPPASSLLYVAISMLLWTVVEYITVWNAKTDVWISFMPWVFLQYLVIIMIFWAAFYVLGWDTKRALVLMLVVMYIFELLWQNFLLLNPVAFLPVSFLLFQLWGFLTFIPHWLLERTMKQNMKLAIVFCLWPITGLIMAIVLG